ncbi:MAG TPA: hypothetical protein PLB10_12550 [Thiolinea sp.]|nr:hypothetical protein [Thiolinea sp.]
MKSVRIRVAGVVIQMLVLLLGLAALFWYFREPVSRFFTSTQSGQLGLVLNGGILVLFLLGLGRIVWLFFSFAGEQRVINRFIQRVRDSVANPAYRLPESLLVRRYEAVKWLGERGEDVDRNMLAQTAAAHLGSRFTLVRFIHNILILAGVFGTIISLSVALVGAADLLDAPEHLERMTVIIGGMATALSTTMTAIICYALYAYFHLRLQDARIRLLAGLEECTALYILPQFRSVESNLMHDVATLTAQLRVAAEMVTRVQDRFLQAGERLQLAVDDLQSQMGRSGTDIRAIRDTLREGFRLPPASGTAPVSRPEPGREVSR